jgi:hypothetical protein
MAFIAERESWTAPPHKKIIAPNPGYVTISWGVSWKEIKAGLTRQMYRSISDQQIELPQARSIGGQMLLYEHVEDCP